MKSKKNKKNKSGYVIRKYTDDIYKQLRLFVKVHAKLTEANLTASDIRSRLHITQRQLNYMETVLYPSSQKKKSKWRRYNIIDLLCIRVVREIAQLQLHAAIINLLFILLKDTIIKDCTLLIDVAKGRQIIILFDYSDLSTPYLYVLPKDEEKYSKRVMNTNNAFTVIPLGFHLRKELTRIATHDFSADLDENGFVIHKIDGEKIGFEELPDSIYGRIKKEIAKHSEKKS